MVIIMTMAAVDECRRSLPGMGHDFFDDVAPSTIFLAPVAMWRSDWEWAQRGASVSLRRFFLTWARAASPPAKTFLGAPLSSINTSTNPRKRPFITVGSRPAATRRSSWDRATLAAPNWTPSPPVVSHSR